MVDYKDASFYTSFFREHPDFIVKEEFKESEDEEEKNLYVGYVEVRNTIHPLILRVEIPKSFPHQHLVFRTKSLSGYPHLIFNGKIQHGSWFCLNTPFAETAEEQLEIEVFRLKEWIRRQLREDLPAYIEDDEVAEALKKANAYGWENLDEVNELHENAALTFVGDFCNDVECFKKSDKLGFLHCINTHDRRFYAFADKKFATSELPYVIVDEFPKRLDNDQDFFELAKQYGWDETVSKHLLPKFNISESWGKAHSTSLKFLSKKTLEESLEILEATKNALSVDEAILSGSMGYNVSYNSSVSNEYSSIKLSTELKEKALEQLKVIEDNIHKNNGYNPFEGMDMDSSVKPYDEMTDEELEEEYERQAREDYYIYFYPYEYHYFALGIIEEDNISWFVYQTNLSSTKYDIIKIDLGLENLSLSKMVSCPLRRLSPQIISKELFWGRGSLSANFQGQKIALVGLGAIGSQVAETLARSGVTAVTLWDNDIVEPGNICRSVYMLSDIGESKTVSIKNKILSINPFVKVNNIIDKGHWLTRKANNTTYVGGSFYDSINYADQEQSMSWIKGHDVIFDCTGSNEILHFLSYAVPGTTIISLCITNHSNDLVCVTNKNGNPFELRKAYLSRIEQDTKNFYLEGSGCYAPTFLAKNCDIASLVNLAIREINKAFESNDTPCSMILSHDKRGILIDRIENYKVEGYEIYMSIPTETIFDAEEMSDATDGNIGYILGCYSRDGKHIMVTHIVDALNAKDILTDAFNTSKGIIDYIGDYTYSGDNPNTYNESALGTLTAKAEDESINTNNPLLAVRNPDGSVSFFLYINNRLVPLTRHV